MPVRCCISDVSLARWMLPSQPPPGSSASCTSSSRATGQGAHVTLWWRICLLGHQRQHMGCKGQDRQLLESPLLLVTSGRTASRQRVWDPILPRLSHPAFAWSVQGDARLHFCYTRLHKGQVCAWLQHLACASPLPGCLTSERFQTVPLPCRDYRNDVLPWAQTEQDVANAVTHVNLAPPGGRDPLAGNVLLCIVSARADTLLF